MNIKARFVQRTKEMSKVSRGDYAILMLICVAQVYRDFAFWGQPRNVPAGVVDITLALIGLGVLTFGVWQGSKYPFRTQIVFFMVCSTLVEASLSAYSWIELTFDPFTTFVDVMWVILIPILYLGTEQDVQFHEAT